MTAAVLAIEFTHAGVVMLFPVVLAVGGATVMNSLLIRDRQTEEASPRTPEGGDGRV